MFTLPLPLAVCGLIAAGSAGCVHSQETSSKFQAAPATAQPADAKAEYELGRRYDQGIGIARDYALAVEHLRQSAEQGYAPAQTSLGSCYAHGEGVTRDYSQAVQWYQKAAAQGDALAEYCLGYACANGKGMPKDLPAAVQWWQKSAEQGQVQVYAQNALGQFYFQGGGPGDTNHVDFAKAAKWLRLAAEQGYLPAMNTLGFLYQNGQGVKQDSSEATKWYGLAAEKGDANAQDNLGLMYENGQGGLPHDIVQAYKWFLLSEEQGNRFGRHDAMELELHGVLRPDQVAKARQMIQEFRAHSHTNQPADNPKRMLD